jgi:heptosyltransferase III
MLKKMTSQPVTGVQRKFALVCARGLGDALLSMILAHNLQLSGKRVTTFSSILCELKDWFCGFHILPYPSPEQLFTTFASFDTLIAADHSLVTEQCQFGNQLIFLKESAFNKRCTMVENLQGVCTEKLLLPFAVSKNGITPLKSLSYRAHPNRVLLHPTSSDTKKNWPSEKFAALATLLEKEGYQPYFCVSPAERQIWKTSVASEQLPHFPTVSHLASFVYESGYLIGNDSGIGHLASALNIPTLSLFARKSYSRLWRPGWGPGTVAAPPNILWGCRMKQKYWKTLLSVGRVKSLFDELREATLAHSSLCEPKF